MIILYRKSQCSPCICVFCADFSTKTEADIILWRHNIPDPVISFLLMLFQPVQTADHHPCTWLVQKLLCHQIPGKSTDFLKIYTASLIKMDDCITCQLFVLIQCHHSMHLSGKTNPSYVPALEPGLLQSFLNGLFNSLPPFQRILFRIRNLRDLYPVTGISYPCCFSIFIHDQCFCTGCSQINTHEIVHN